MAFQPNPGLLNIGGLPTARTGKTTDICYIPGNNIWFGGLHPSAVKIFRVGATNHIQKERLDNMLTVLSEHLLVKHAAYNHANIAPAAVVNAFITTNNGPMTFKALLTPWYSEGDVLEYVKIYPVVERIALLIEIGKALKHLHTHNVVHGAIHPSNVLVDNDGHVVITDTGVYTLMSQFIFLPSGGRVPVLPSAIYQPCEQLYPATDTLVQPTTSMDVYSLATTAWAIFSGKEPFSDLPKFRTLEQVVKEIGLRGHECLVNPSDMSPGLWAILKNCLAADPALRLTMEEVVAELQSFVS